MNEYVDIPVTPVSGLNVTDSESAVSDQEASDSRNFLFESKNAVTRPGLTGFSLGPTSPVIYANAVEGDWFANVFLTADNKIWRRWVDGTTTNIPITGAVSWGPEQFMNMAKVNGAMMIGNNSPNGLVHWVAGAGATVLTRASDGSGVDYLFVVGHYSRAFAAHQRGSLNGLLKVAWSVPGDETVWEAPPNTINGSGSAILADAPDWISGLSVIRNVVIIYRYGGIHVGYANSSNSPAYSFQTWTKDRIGLTHPSTLASANDLNFFIGQDEVRVFDLNQITNIGQKIRRLLAPFIDSGVPIVGFVTTDAYKPSPFGITDKLRYHLIPLPYYGSTTPPLWPPTSLNTNPFSTCSTLHFIYSVEDGNWSVHDYDFSPTTAWNLMGDPVGLVDPTAQGPCLVEGAVPVGHLWDDSQPCERCSYVVGKQQTAGSLETDWLLQRVLLRHRDLGAANIQASVQSRLNYTAANSALTKSIGLNNDGYWVRSWYDFLGNGTQQGTGQTFLPRVDVPRMTRFNLDYINLRLTGPNEYRGQ